MGRSLRLVRRRRDGTYYYVYAGREVPLAEANRALFFGGEEGAALAERWAELLDEDLARFHEVVSVAEELAEHVFRGRAVVQRSIDVTPHITIASPPEEGAGHRLVATILLYYDLGRRRRRTPLHVGGIKVWEVPVYEAAIVLTRRWPNLYPVGGSPSGLERLFLEELAEIFGEPEILELVRGDRPDITLYRRGVRLGGEE
jgi:hypothetical protein